MASLVRWLKTRASSRGRSKERKKSVTDSGKELPHPSTCVTPNNKQECPPNPDQRIPDILVHSGSTTDLTLLGDEELIHLQRNAPLRRTLPPIPLDQSPHKPGLSPEGDDRRLRSLSASPGSRSPRPAPVYEEIEDDIPRSQCGPYLVVAIPDASCESERNTQDTAGHRRDADHRECLMQDTAVQRRHTDHQKGPVQGQHLFAYRYSCHLQDPHKYHRSLPSRSPTHRTPVINRDVYTLPAHLRKSRSPSADQDSVDECYEYDFDSSCGGHSSDFTFSPGSREEDEEDDVISGVYPLSKVKGHGPRSQSNASNETYNEYDCRSSDLSYHDVPVQVSGRQRDVMMKRDSSEPYFLTPQCSSPHFDGFRPISPHFQHQMSSPIQHHHQHPPMVYQHSPFLSPQVQRKCTYRSQSYDPNLREHMHCSTVNYYARDQGQHAVGQHAVGQHAVGQHDRCRECGSYSQEPTKQELFAIAEEMHSPMLGRSQRPRPTLGVSAMCYRKSQGGSLAPRSRFSHDFELGRSLVSKPDQCCSSKQQSSRCQPRATSAGGSMSSRPVLTMDLPEDKDKFSIRVTLSREGPGSQARLRQAAATQMQQARLAQSKHNRLLQDLMQVNFDRQNLATAMS